MSNMRAPPSYVRPRHRSEEALVGRAVVAQGKSPSANFAAVFEDDGQTGYFYALDLSSEIQPIDRFVLVQDRPRVDDEVLGLFSNREP